MRTFEGRELFVLLSDKIWISIDWAFHGREFSELICDKNVESNLIIFQEL